MFKLMEYNFSSIVTNYWYHILYIFDLFKHQINTLLFIFNYKYIFG